MYNGNGDYMDFLSKLGIVVKNEALLMTALTHKSYTNEHHVEHYERLEFLGDAVLQLAMSEYFYTKTNYTEGEMSKLRASYVCESALAEYSNSIGLTENIRVSAGMETVKKSVIADCFESVLGVIFLEHGYSVAKKYVLKIIVPYIENGVVFVHDYKSYLQEMVHMQRKTVEYVITDEYGPHHMKTYEADVIVDGIKFGHGIGTTKQLAEQAAAEDAIGKMAR